MSAIEYVFKRPDGRYLGYFGVTKRQLRALRVDRKSTAEDLRETFARVHGDKDLRIVKLRIRPPRRSLPELREAFASFSEEASGWWPLELLLRDLERHDDRSACARELLGILERHPHFEGREKRKTHPLFTRLEIPGTDPALLVESLRRTPSFIVMRMLSGDGFAAPGARDMLREITLTHADERMRRRARAWFETSGHGIETGERITPEEWKKRHDGEGID